VPKDAERERGVQELLGLLEPVVEVSRVAQRVSVR
jgi:hypothetical protein